MEDRAYVDAYRLYHPRLRPIPNAGHEYADIRLDPVLHQPETVFHRERAAKQQWNHLLASTTVVDVKGKHFQSKVGFLCLESKENPILLHWPVKKINLSERDVSIARFYRVGQANHFYWRIKTTILNQCLLCNSFYNNEIPQVQYYIIHVKESFELFLPRDIPPNFSKGKEIQQIIFFQHFCVLKHFIASICSDIYPLFLSILWTLYKQEASFEHSNYKKMWWSYWSKADEAELFLLNSQMRNAMYRPVQVMPTRGARRWFSRKTCTTESDRFELSDPQ